MKRALFVLILAIALFFATGMGVCAEDGATYEILEEFDSIIPESSGVSRDKKLESYIGIPALIREISTAVNGEGSRYALFFTMAFGFAVIISVSEATVTCGDSSLSVTSSAALSALLSATLFTSLREAFFEVRGGLEDVVGFFSDLLPIITALNVSAGAVESTAVQATGIGITLAILGKISVEILLPMAFALFILSFSASVTGSSQGVANGVRGFFMWGIGIVSTVLAASLAIQSLVASAADSAAIRAARYAASGMIPIVGTSVSSALSTLSGGLAFVRSTVGAGAIAVILSLSLAPLVSLLIYRFAISFCIFFLESSGTSGGVRSFSAFRASLDGVIAVYSMSILVCIIELVVFIKGGAVA